MSDLTERLETLGRYLHATDHDSRDVATIRDAVAALAAAPSRTPGAQEQDAERDAVAEGLRTFIRLRQTGGCRMLSVGADCDCPLCLIDRLVDRGRSVSALSAEVARLTAERDEALSVIATAKSVVRKHQNPDGRTTWIVTASELEALERALADAALRGETK